MSCYICTKTQQTLPCYVLAAGMEISVPLFIAQWKNIISAIVILLVGKLAVMVAAGQMFGLSRMASIRAGEQPSCWQLNTMQLQLDCVLLCASIRVGTRSSVFLRL